MQQSAWAGSSLPLYCFPSGGIYGTIMQRPVSPVEQAKCLKWASTQDGSQTTCTHSLAYGAHGVACTAQNAGLCAAHVVWRSRQSLGTTQQGKQKTQPIWDPCCGQACSSTKNAGNLMQHTSKSGSPCTASNRRQHSTRTACSMQVRTQGMPPVAGMQQYTAQHSPCSSIEHSTERSTACSSTEHSEQQHRAQHSVQQHRAQHS
jgi:hypothetical protein